MHASDEPDLADLSELSRLLPRWVDAAAQRIAGYAEHGWDINGLWLLRDDARRLSAASAQHGIDEAAAGLGSLAEQLAAHLDPPTLPDAERTREWQALIERLADHLPQFDSAVPASARVYGDVTRMEVPPAGYWRRWAEDAPPAVPSAPPAVSTSPAPAPEPVATRAPVAPPERAPAAGAPDGKRISASLRIYHLSDRGALSEEIDRLLTTQGHVVEALDDADSLRELLGALPADLVLIDAAFAEDLEAIGAVLRAMRGRAESRLLLIAIASQDDVALRLAARRAGTDALLVGPADAGDVLRQIRALLDPVSEAPYRVLVVEDDNSQALFAESILRNAGMDARVVTEPFEVLPAMEAFLPDLVLMDLHMPRCNGIELTALIREREHFLHTPIVFLSGESDQDLQFEALDAGGDDFLAKPVRPRHLIAAVQNRISRARAIGRRRSQREARDPASGLHSREAIIDGINEALIARMSLDDGARGGVVFLDLEAAPLLRERLGLTALEALADEAGVRIGTHLGDTAQAARFGDTSFIVLAPDHDEAALESLAAGLREAIYAQDLQAGGRPIRLRFSAGICALDHGFADAGTLLNAAERTCREARSREHGVKLYQPPRSTDSHRESGLLAQIRKALAEGGFELIYQPIVAVQGGEEAQYQTLLRLPGENGRSHAAGEIVPLAERHGLMAEIDRWVLDEALSVLQRRQSQTHAVRLFVTQSAATLTLDGQAGWLREALARHGVAGPSLVIEIRLDDAIVHTDSIQQFCQSLVDDGVQFCLSQFESSLDSAGLLDRLPLGLIKLAPKYLGASATQALRDELRVLIDQAHRRNLQVIGHRVEDAHSAATLWMSGIDYLQGNLVQQAGSTLDFDFHSAVL